MKSFRISAYALVTSCLCLLLVSGCAAPAPSTQSPATGDSTKPQEKVTLIVYSTHPEKMLEAVADAYTQKTGTAVEFTNFKGELADRVRSEKDSPQADVMYGGSSSLFISMAKEGIFEPTSPSWASGVENRFKDPQGQWFATMQTPVVLFYNKDMLSAQQAPSSWKDLADPAFAGQIVSRDGLSSSQRATISALLYEYEKSGKVEEGFDYLKALDANTKNYYNSGSEHFQVIGKKEAPISYGVLSAVQENIKKNNLPLEVVYPQEGAVVISDAIAAIKGAPHPKEASEFIEFAGSVMMQTQLAQQFDRMPVLPEALQQSADWMKTSFNVLDTDWSVVAEKENAWLTKWENEIRNASKEVKPQK